MEAAAEGRERVRDGGHAALSAVEAAVRPFLRGTQGVVGGGARGVVTRVEVGEEPGAGA